MADKPVSPAELLARAGDSDSAYCAGARDMLGAVRNAVREYACEDNGMADAFDRALGFVSTREDAAYRARLAARRFERDGGAESALALMTALDEAFSPEWDDADEAGE